MTPSRPGAHERLLLRRRNNPLFDAILREVEPDELAAARHKDHAELEDFAREFHVLLDSAVRLRPNEESQTLLDLKARLDEAYTRLASLGGDTEAFKLGLRRLTDTIISTVRQAAADDPHAVEELTHEQLAREQHYRLMEFPLVADLMRPDSPIAAEGLAATLLSAPRDELEAALWLFGPEELARLCRDARALLSGAGTDYGYENLALMELHCPKSEPR
jgi:hypothetical protein